MVKWNSTIKNVSPKFGRNPEVEIKDEKKTWLESTSGCVVVWIKKNKNWRFPPFSKTNKKPTAGGPTERLIKMMTRAKKTQTRKTRQLAYGVDYQKMLAKTDIEWHWPGHQYLGAGTQLQKRLKCAIPASIDWTNWPNNTTSITVGSRLWWISGKPMPRWLRPSTAYPAVQRWPSGSSRGSCKPREHSSCKKQIESGQAFFSLPL